MEYCGSKYVSFLITVPFLLLLFLSGNALGLPCKGETAYLGETMQEVTAKCGEAAFKEQRTVTVAETVTKMTGTIITSTTTTTSTTSDEWAYDFGPEELVQSYLFEKGILKNISSKGFGPTHDFSIDPCRDGAALTVGDNTVETYVKCGEPIAKEKLKNKVIESEYGVTLRRTIVPVVEWTYRYGPDAPGYTITFENGVAVNIRMREFGK